MAIQVPDTQNEVSIFSEWFSANFMKSPGLTASSLSGCSFGLFLYNFHLNQHLIGHSVLWRTAEWVRKINRFFYKILGHQRLKSQNTLFQKAKSRELTSASFRPGTSRLAISSCLAPSLVRPSVAMPRRFEIRCWGHGGIPTSPLLPTPLMMPVAARTFNSFTSW